MPVQTSYSLQQQATGSPGSPVDGTSRPGRTCTAATAIFPGAPVQLKDSGVVEPLAAGGIFQGIAGLYHFDREGGGGSMLVFVQYDNVPIADAGAWWLRADKAFAAGAGLNWNTATGRWTDAAAGGSIVATPGVEAMQASSGPGAPIKAKIVRKR